MPSITRSPTYWDRATVKLDTINFMPTESIDTEERMFRTGQVDKTNELPNTKIELLYPLGDNSPIKGFLEKNPSGGIHHICYEVDDILAARDHLKASGARVLGTGEPKIGAHGKPVLFLHPKDFNGCLVELEQA